MAFRVPQLDDGVVRLRMPDAGDVDAIVAACQDEEIGRFTAIPWPYERRHAVEFVTAAPRAWAAERGAPFVVVHARSGELLGSTGLANVQPDRGTAEVGYWVKADARGQGVATRALRLVCEWALGELGLTRLELQADVRNAASQRVAEKAGFRREGEGPASGSVAGRIERVVRFGLSGRQGPEGSRGVTAS